MRITASPNARVSCSVIGDRSAADGHSLPQPYTRPGAFARPGIVPSLTGRSDPHSCSMPEPYATVGDAGYTRNCIAVSLPLQLCSGRNR
jgi:hypothetical protein